MEWDYERQSEKETELRQEIFGILKQVDIPDAQIEEITNTILEQGIRVTPPEKNGVVLEYVMMRPSGRGGGRSTKAGNIKLNIGSLFNAIASGVFTAISTTTAPWAIPFAAILLWNSLWKSVNVDLSENDAVTLWAMWQVKDSNKLVSEEDIKQAIDKHAAKYQRSTLSEADIKFSLDNLMKIGCIKRPKQNHEKWWLCEWIAPAYR